MSIRRRMPHLLQRSAKLLIAALTIIASPCVSAETQNKPNVLFIAVDDLKPALGVYGDELAITPNIDRLAAMGTVFTNAHCQQAVCAPSRVSLLTGLRPDTTKVWDLKTEFRDALPDVITLPQLFKNAGYQSVGMGKIFDPRSAGGRQAMDEVSWSKPFVNVDGDPSSETFSYRNPATVALIQERLSKLDKAPKGYGARLKAAFPDGKPSTDRADVPDNHYHDGTMTDIAVEHLDDYKKTGEPFFLAVGFKKPHLPFNAPKKYWALYDDKQIPLAQYTQAPEGTENFALQPGWELRSNYDVPREGPIDEAKQRELIQGYYACTSYIDAQVGRLLDKLEANGQLANTIIILWGDHGWHLGDHDMWCKHSNFEQATRSPLIIAAPGVGPKGTKAAAPVEFVDIYPTLADLAGLKTTGELHGVSLRPMLESPDASVKPFAVSQYGRKSAGKDLEGYSLRTERYRYTAWRQQDVYQGQFNGEVVHEELYDYETDPLETRNLAKDDAYAKVLNQMREYLTQVPKP